MQGRPETTESAETTESGVPHFVSLLDPERKDLKGPDSRQKYPNHLKCLSMNMICCLLTDIIRYYMVSVFIMTD